MSIFRLPSANVTGPPRRPPRPVSISEGRRGKMNRWTPHPVNLRAADLPVV
ncbi:MAG: hypothetical protein GW893_24315 [Armatimonadetes bacterium]|nr:hypothetical protein [Armatimonadota bacterium]